MEIYPINNLYFESEYQLDSILVEGEDRNLKLREAYIKGATDQQEITKKELTSKFSKWFHREWTKIKRGPSGFASNTSLDKMYDSLPVILVSRQKGPDGLEDIEMDYVTVNNWDIGEYFHHPKYTEYMPCPELEMKEE